MPDHESVFLEIHLKKQKFMSMGINLNKQLGEKPDINGNQNWALPNSMLLENEDFY